MPTLVTPRLEMITDQHAVQAQLLGPDSELHQVPRTELLVLDEPTNHLDIRFQLELLDLVRGLGVTTIAAIHDLGLAAAHCDRIYVLEHGSVVAAGPPRDVLTAEHVARVFGVRLRDWTDPDTGRTHLSFDRLVADDEPAAAQTPVASLTGEPSVDRALPRTPAAPGERTC